MTAIYEIQNAANEISYDSNKKRFVSNLYWALVNKGMKPCIVNGLYLEVAGTNYHLVNNKRKGSYTICKI
ncbi:hypothetical protein [Sodaliphilus pleomorphus]|jgi:hypothetical protein|uniref:Uncharacterized protein n=1 Tax=Sodaliphilus pleomorphus TaxID=2606626 RepID=A0A6L5XCK8_9BACT|nr:hypothetical protein [Sodaliphilus pleomorphus]MSS16806.1 hypothetical protein [Sodaliphilus pleomorphus]